MRERKGLSGKKVHRRIQWSPYIMILPSVILMIGIFGYPICKVFLLSLQNYNYADFANTGFIGLENFKTIFTNDDVVGGSILFTVKWVVVEVGLQLVFGMILALLLNCKFKGRGIVRSLSLIPWAVSGVLTTMLWMLILNQSIGLVNTLMMKGGASAGNVPAWLASPKLIFFSVVMIELWRGIPFFAITLLAAMQSIPGDIYEACDIDGAGRTAKFRYITLPYLKETIVLTTLLRSIWEFNSTDMIFTLTNGGPVNLTTTLPIYMMKTSIVNGNYGYGSALGVLVFFFLLIFAVLYMKLSKFGGDGNE